MRVSDCRIFEFKKIADRRGNLSVIEGERDIPFAIKRVFYVYDIPGGEERGAHAHGHLHQVLVCLAGSVDVNLDDGFEKRTVHLNRPWYGLHIPPMIWASEGNFDTGTVYMVATSDYYDAADYYRDYDAYLSKVKGTP